MSDPLAALSELVDRVEQGLADGSLDTERAVQLRAVEPLLEVLGWDVRGPAVVPDATVADVRVDYLLTIDDAPVVAVRTADPDDGLASDYSNLVAVLDAHRIDRAIETDGRSVRLLVATDDGVHSRSTTFPEFTDETEALGAFHRSVLEAERTDDHRSREAAARQLAEHREEVVAAVTSEITSVTGPDVEPFVADASARAVDSVIDELGSTWAASSPSPADGGQDEPVDSQRGTTDGQSGAQDGQEETANDLDGTTPAETAPGETTPDDTVPGDSTALDDTVPDRTKAPDEPVSGESAPHQTAPEEPVPEDSAPTEEVGTDDASAASGGAESGGEYVVRFFGGSSSVGAVGTESPGGTTVGTVRYLLENHDLLGSITLPWRSESGTVVVAASADDSAVTLQNEEGQTVAVQPLDSPSAAKTAIRDLADVAGLRVMFQGDW